MAEWELSRLESQFGRRVTRCFLELTIAETMNENSSWAVAQKIYDDQICSLAMTWLSQNQRRCDDPTPHNVELVEGGRGRATDAHLRSQPRLLSWNSPQPLVAYNLIQLYIQSEKGARGLR